MKCRSNSIHLQHVLHTYIVPGDNTAIFLLPVSVPNNAMTTAEVEDFGFADSPALFSHIRSPGAIANGTPGPGNTIPLDDDDGFFSTGLGDVPLEMFKIERAQLNLNITILQLVVSNNILIMASTDSKIYKIDLTLQEQIVGMASLSIAR